jgi:hypothetical protein
VMTAPGNTCASWKTSPRIRVIVSFTFMVLLRVPGALRCSKII